MKNRNYSYRELRKKLNAEVELYENASTQVLFAKKLAHHIRLLIWEIERKYSLPEWSRHDLWLFFWEIPSIVEPDNPEESEYWFGHELIGGSWSIHDVINTDTADRGYARILKKVRKALLYILKNNHEWTSREKILRELNDTIGGMEEFKDSGTLFMLDNEE